MEQNCKPLCKYFLHGACSQGSKCSFSHDLKAKKDNVCKFYQAGNCNYGKGCRYDHVKPSTTISIARNTIVVKPPPKIETLKGPEKKPSLVLLKKKQRQPPEDQSLQNDNWIKAPDFVPGRMVHRTTEFEDVDQENQSRRKIRKRNVLKDVSYSKIASFNSDQIEVQEGTLATYDGDHILLLCPFEAVRVCPYGEKCVYLHGDMCDICQRQCLHPTNEHLRKKHIEECTKKCVEDMEVAFAAQRSNGVECLICLEVVREKADITQRMFGLLENCHHPFCLSCIRKWRASYGADKAVVRTCPICRSQSWFVTPSEFWIEEEEKQRVVNEYKQHLSTKHCRLFDRGRGNCQFGTSCFYKHAYPDGSLEEGKIPDLRYREDGLGNVSVVKSSRLDEFIAYRDTT